MSRTETANLPTPQPAISSPGDKSKAGHKRRGPGGRAVQPTVVLVAPNVSRLMGGEALKALHIWLGLAQRGVRVIQVTHMRVADQLEAMSPPGEVVHIHDDALQLWMIRNNWWGALSLYNALLLNRAAQKAAREHGAWLVHYTSPISPSLPYFRMKGFPTIIGPLNGNIPYPKPLDTREPTHKRRWRQLLPLLQPFSDLIFSGKRRAARILVAGGERTKRALEYGLIKPDRMVETLDSGVSDELLERPRITHKGRLNRFVFIGRLVAYKGCDMVIRAIAQVPDAQLDIIGDGEERQNLQRLCEELGVADRVHFLGLLPGGKAVFDALRNYRAFLFPTLAEANGIVVQEAMMLGLPVVALDWGGPALLLDAETGILIKPKDEAEVVKDFAAAAQRLMDDGEFADRLARNARARAERDGYAWSALIDKWLHIYDEIMAENGQPGFTTQAAKEAARAFG